MNCNQSYKYFRGEISDDDFTQHQKSCKSCSDIIARINQTIAILDEKVEVPSGLTEKVLNRKSQMGRLWAMPTFDMSKYLQLASVVAVEIFIGVFLGSRANPKTFFSKKDKKEKALIEYRESHHFADQSSIYSF